MTTSWYIPRDKQNKNGMKMPEKPSIVDFMRSGQGSPVLDIEDPDAGFVWHTNSSSAEYNRRYRP